LINYDTKLNNIWGKYQKKAKKFNKPPENICINLNKPIKFKSNHIKDRVYQEKTINQKYFEG
jgi:hypothetical protein